MVHRRQTGPSCGGGRNRPAYHIPAGSLQPTTYGSGPGPRNNKWNGRGNSNPRHYNQNQNRTHDFLPHQPVHFGAPSPVQPQGNFRQGQGQGYNRRPKNPRFQTQQGGGFNAPNHGHQASQFQRNARSVSPIPFQAGFEDHLSAPFPTGPKNRRRRNRRNQVDIPQAQSTPSTETNWFGQQPAAFNAYSAYSAALDIEMAEASHLDTDIDMPDAPPLECYQIDNWISEPVNRFQYAVDTFSNGGCHQTLLVAEGLASANEMLSRIEYFVRTGTMPPPNVNFHG